MKLAFQYWRSVPLPGRKKRSFVPFARLPRDTLGDVSVGDLERFHHCLRRCLFPALRAPAPYCYRCPLGLDRRTCKIDCVEVCGNRPPHADTLAGASSSSAARAGAAGMITAPAVSCEGARGDARVRGVLIADEVAVWFATGSLFACDRRVTRILCLAKG